MKVKKIKEIKKYQQDIWGLILEKGKYQNYTKKVLEESSNKRESLGTLVLENKNINKRKKSQSLYGKLLVLRRKLCLFYGDLRYKDYKRIGRFVKNKKGNYSENFINELERRLDVVIYRLHFTRSIDEARVLIREKGVLVNKQVIVVKGYKLNEGDVIEINETHKEEVFKKLEYRVKNEDFFTGVQKNLEVNYETLSGCLVSKIKVEEVSYPFKVPVDYFSKEQISLIR